jgi:ATP-dependent protease ClpP protease subunit
MDLTRLKTTRPLAKLRSGRTDWYRIEAKADAATVWLFDEIGYFGVTAQDFVAELVQLDAKRITLHINSPGGDVFDGVAIHSSLRQHPAAVDVVVDGLAASAASFIAMAGDTITMARNAMLMIHDGLCVTIGNAADHAKTVDLLDKASDNMADIYAQRAGGTVPEWRARMREETWYTATEAQQAGLCDVVLDADDDQALAAAFDLSIFNYAGRASAPAPVVPTTAAPTIDWSAVALGLKEAIPCP